MGRRRSYDVSEQLKTAIRASGLTVYRVASDAGMKPDNLAKYLAGKRDIRSAAFSRLCRVLGLELRPKEGD
jgi:hypothetical protein